MVFTAAPGQNTIDGPGGRRRAARQLRADQAGRASRHRARAGAQGTASATRSTSSASSIRSSNRRRATSSSKTTRSSGWGGVEHQEARPCADDDGAIHCNYYRETDARRSPPRIIVQRNRIHDPRHGANPWQARSAGQSIRRAAGSAFDRCGRTTSSATTRSTLERQPLQRRLRRRRQFQRRGLPVGRLRHLRQPHLRRSTTTASRPRARNRNVRIWGNHLTRCSWRLPTPRPRPGRSTSGATSPTGMAGMYQPDGNPDPSSAALHQGRQLAAGSQRRPGLLLPQHRDRCRNHRALGRAGQQLRGAQQRRPASRVDSADGAFDLKEGSPTDSVVQRPLPAARGRRAAEGTPLRFSAEAYRAGRSADRCGSRRPRPWLRWPRLS